MSDGMIYRLSLHNSGQRRNGVMLICTFQKSTILKSFTPPKWLS